MAIKNSSQSKFHAPCTLSGNAIKLLACISMFCDHYAKAASLTGISYVIMSDILGRLAFPLFCFLLTEGYFHTHRIGRYIRRMLLFAVVSEIPFNLAFWGRPIFPGHQNTLFTLTLGLLMFSGLDRIKKKGSRSIYLTYALQAIIIVFSALIAEVLHLDYGFGGILILTALYFYNGGFSIRRPLLGMFWGNVCLCISATSNPAVFLSLLPINFYNGSRGKLQLKYAFYSFYPLHLVLLFILFYFL